MDIDNFLKTAGKVEDFLNSTGGKTANPTDIYFEKNKKLRKAGVEIALTSHQLDQVYAMQTDIHYMADNSLISVKTAKRGIQKLKLRDFQREMLTSYFTKNRVATNASRQIGKTVINNYFVINYALYNSDQEIWILANKGRTAKKILKRLKIMYESLPLWLQQGIVSWNSESAEFENGTIINVGTTSSESARGEDIALLILDEFGRIPPHIEDDFVESVFPTVSSDPDTKIFMVSTPRGISNTFYHTCHKAMLQTPDNEYTYHEYDWTVVPERDEAWKNKALQDLKGNLRRFSQEYECAFLGSSKTLIKTEVLKSLVAENPLHEENSEYEHDPAYCYYQHVENDHQYVAVADIAKGKGRAASTVQIIDITDIPFKQVARYENQDVGTHDFSEIVVNMATEYNKALIVPENNGIGEAVCNDVIYTHEYDNVFMMDNGDVGFNTNTQTRTAGCDEIANLIENDLIKIVDQKSINQFTTFVKIGSTYKPDGKSLSDLIMPLIIFGSMVSDPDIAMRYLDLDTAKLWNRKTVKTETSEIDTNTMVFDPDDMDLDFDEEENAIIEELDGYYMMIN